MSYDLISGETKILESDEENNFTLIHCAADKMHMISHEPTGSPEVLQTLLSAQRYILSEEQSFEIMKLNFDRTSEYCIWHIYEVSDDMRYLLCEVKKKRRIALAVLDLKNEEILCGDELPNEIWRHRYDKEHNAFIYIGIKTVYAAFICEEGIKCRKLFTGNDIEDCMLTEQGAVVLTEKESYLVDVELPS